MTKKGIVIDRSRGKGSSSSPFTSILTLFLVLLFSSACTTQGNEGGTGTISFTLKMPPASAGAVQYKDALFDCDAYGVVDVVAQVSLRDQSISTGGPWPCDTGEGIIPGVEEGEDYRIAISMRDAEGLVLFQGSKSGIDVVAGMTTEAGTIELIDMRVNRPPVLSPIGTRHFTMSAPGTITVSASDPDGDALTYEIAGMPEPYGSGYLRGMSLDPVSHVFTWEPGSEDYQPGEYKVLFRVTDSGTPRLSDYEWVTIQAYDSSTEIDGRMYPVLAPIGNRQVAAGQSLQFTISATDADPNDTLVYSAGAVPGKAYPSNSSFIAETRQFVWSSPNPAGNYWVRFLANDNHDLSNQQLVFEDVVITVGDVNRPPALDPMGARRVIRGESIQFVITASDPEEDSLSYSAAAIVNDAPAPLPTGASLNAAAQVFSWNTLIEEPYGYQTIRITVTDSNGESDYEDVDILLY